MGNVIKSLTSAFASSQDPLKVFNEQLFCALLNDDHQLIASLLENSKEQIMVYNVSGLLSYTIQFSHNDLFFDLFSQYSAAYKAQTDDIYFTNFLLKTAIVYENKNIFNYLMENNVIYDEDGVLLLAAVETCDADYVNKLLPHTDVTAQKSAALHKALNFKANTIIDMLLPLSDITSLGYLAFNIVYRNNDETNCKKLLEFCNPEEVLSYLEFDAKRETHDFVEKVCAQQQKERLQESLIGCSPVHLKRKQKI